MQNLPTYDDWVGRVVVKHYGSISEAVRTDVLFPEGKAALKPYHDAAKRSGNAKELSPIEKDDGDPMVAVFSFVNAADGDVLVSVWYDADSRAVVIDWPYDDSRDNDDISLGGFREYVS